MNSEVVIWDDNGETRLRTKIELAIPEEDASSSPSFAACRHGVLRILTASESTGYVVYDRLLSRIVDGVYYLDSGSALDVARLFNEHSKLDGTCDATGAGELSPNSSALGLIFPDPPVFPEK